MKHFNKVFEDISNSFRGFKGVSAIKTDIYFPNYKLIVYILIKYFNANPSISGKKNVLIFVKSVKDRFELIKELEANKIDDKVRVLTESYINVRYTLKHDFIITVDLTESERIYDYIRSYSKFTLCIFTNISLKDNFNTYIYNKFNFIKYNSNVVESNRIRVNSPVENNMILVELNQDDRELYEEYTKYINTSMIIFGDINNITKCRSGDIYNNISAAQYRYSLAVSNGWREDLDMSNEFDRQLDETYNPNSIYEKANVIFDITKKRRNLITDAECKLHRIKEIVDNNRGKKIIIVSRRGEFANVITDYINSEVEICGNYHDKIPESEMINENGDIILIKSGVDKGKPKVFKHKAISTLNNKRYNEGNINILSIKYSADKSLDCSFDILIFTSPYCGEIKPFKERFYKLKQNTDETKLYTIICNDTNEITKFESQNKDNNHTLIRDTNFLSNDETFGGINL